MNDAERYLSLRTFRRDGRAVDTAVWFAADDAGVLWIFSAGAAGKVKRLRLTARVEVAPCDARGGVTGSWTEGRGRLVSDPDEIATALVLLRRKYRWQSWLTDVGARLSGRFNKRAYIAIGGL